MERRSASNVEVARQAELVVLAHKPTQLEEVAREIAADVSAVASILARRRSTLCAPRIPGVPSIASFPRCRSRSARAPSCRRQTRSQDPELDARVRELFASLGTLVTLEDRLLDVAMCLMSCAPAYVALVAEAQVDAGVRYGIPAAAGAELVVQTLAGTAELLRRRSYDTLAVRREVSSPGGLTVRGLDALEHGGVRAAFSDAMDAVMRETR